MASFAFGPLHQVQFHLLSPHHCKHSSALNAFQFLPSFRYVTVSKHAKPTPKIQATKLHRVTGQELSESDLINGPGADYVSGLPSFAEISKRDGKRERRRAGAGAGEAIEKKDAPKGRNEKVGNTTTKRRKVVGSGNSSLRVKGEVLDKNVDKRRTEGENDKVTVVERVNRSKKFKIDPPETTLRLGLDMCSKRGDIDGAIKLYDLAKKDGIKMGQYHYAVLLYLCSSAATGMVQPAKSGSGGRSLSPSDPVEGNSVVGSESLNEYGEMAKWMHAGRESSEQNAEREPVIEHLEGNGLAMNGVPVEVDGNELSRGHEGLGNFTNESTGSSSQSLEDLVQSLKNGQYSSTKNGGKRNGIQMNDDVKRVALRKGFEIYNDMCKEKVAMNEATLTSVARMAMAFGDGDMAFDVVKQMVEFGINPRLRSYGPALAIFCSNGDVEKAFVVETHMLEHGVHPEEPELEALLRVSVEAGKSDRVYYVLHRLRTCVRQVSEATADLIERWFKSNVASKVGKRKWDKQIITKAIENGGGGWHGKGWLGQGKWNVCRSPVDSDGSCKSCGEKLATIDLDPAETESFAKSVASIASRREKNSSFQKFQKWLDYYGPFEAVVDAANIGLYSQRNFKPSKVNAVVNGIRQMLPSRKWPLIVLHNRRISGDKMDEPFNKSLIEKWKTADALYSTPTGSNDDWYWLYAAIKCRCLIVTNDEMRDHLFQLLGNDFFPKWKERHQVHFSFTETGPVFHMPPPCSIVIQESEKGHWHIPIVPKLENEDERVWLCCTRGNSGLQEQDSSGGQREPCLSQQKHRKTSVVTQAKLQVEPGVRGQRKQTHIKNEFQESKLNTDSVALPSVLRNKPSVLSKLDSAEKIGGCVIDFQI